MNDFEDRLSAHVARSTPERVPPFADVLARRDRRRHRRRAALGGGTTVAAVAAVTIGVGIAGDRQAPDRGGASGDPTSTPTATTRPEPTYELANEPSPVVVRLADRDVSLDPWTYCWSGPAGTGGVASGVCSDGSPGKVFELDDVGTPASVELWFGVDDWEFQATFAQVGVDCPRRFTVDAEPTGDHTFRLDPAGPAGRYQVDLFGRGNGGDVAASFVWTTPTDGPVEPPAASIALVTDADAELTSYGLELGVSGLGFQPRQASARVTATAANGRSMTLTPPRDDVRGGDGDCYEQGSLFFRGDDAQARSVAELGPAPYTYDVVLTLDGRDYVGTAVWPRDEKADEAPYTTLTFDPPLPAYAP